MTVRAKEMVNGQVVEPSPTGFGARIGAALRRIVGLRKTWPIGVVLLVAGAVGWMAGARFTATGLPAGANTVFGGLFGIQLGLPAPREWALLLATILAGGFFSRVEVTHRPFRLGAAAAEGKRRKWEIDGPGHWLAWGIVIAIDVASTFVGVSELVKEPPGAVWPLFLDIARSREYNGLTSLVLTFLPELSLIGGWALMWKRRT